MISKNCLKTLKYQKNFTFSNFKNFKQKISNNRKWEVYPNVHLIFILSNTPSTNGSPLVQFHQ